MTCDRGASRLASSGVTTALSAVTKRATVRLALWLLVRLVPLQKAIVQVDLHAQLISRIRQLRDKPGIRQFSILRFIVGAVRLFG